VNAATDANNTPEPPSPASAAETDNTGDKELQDEMNKWKERMSKLKDKENFEDKVSDEESYPLHTVSSCIVIFAIYLFIYIIYSIYLLIYYENRI